MCCWRPGRSGCWPLAILAAAALLCWHVRRNHGLLTGARPVGDLAAARPRWSRWCCFCSGIRRSAWPRSAAAERDRGAGGRLAQHGHPEGGGTREDRLKALLDGGLLDGLGKKFQVRLYRFGKEAERIQKTDSAEAGARPRRASATA